MCVCVCVCVRVRACVRACVSEELGTMRERESDFVRGAWKNERESVMLYRRSLEQFMTLR